MITVYVMTNCGCCSDLIEYLVNKNIGYTSYDLKYKSNRKAREFYRNLDIKNLPIITWDSKGETYLLQGWNESVKKKFEELYDTRTK